jgi:hypothetical protein
VDRLDLLTVNGHGQLIVSAATALFGELPLAAALSLLSIRALHVGARAARALEHDAPITMAYAADHIPRPCQVPLSA